MRQLFLKHKNRWFFSVSQLTLILSIGCTGSLNVPVKELSRYAIPDTLATSNQIPQEHIVSKGENISFIAWLYRLDPIKIATINNLSPPYALHQKQKIVLSYPNSNTSSIKNASHSEIKGVECTSGAYDINKIQVFKQKNCLQKRVAEKALKQNLEQSKKIGWIWPLQGAVISHFSKKGEINSGIDINGTIGDPVIAASPGTVVYAGDNLPGYGRLILIEHVNDEFISAYAHNSKLITREGAQVKVGEKIAEVGSTGTDEPKLHFEIRYKGKPVNPEVYLPTADFE